MAQPSLNPIAAESVSHGSTVQIVANGVVIGEIIGLKFDEDPHMEALKFLGSKRISRRPGLFEIKGSCKGYLINGVARSLWMGLGTPTAAGGGSTIYHSTRTNTRYNLVIQNNDAAVSQPPLTLINVTFSKDAMDWEADKFVTEDLTFDAEDTLGS